MGGEQAANVLGQIKRDAMTKRGEQWPESDEELSKRRSGNSMSIRATPTMLVQGSGMTASSTCRYPPGAGAWSLRIAQCTHREDHLWYFQDVIMTGVTLSLDKRDVATLTIDRAEVHNAFDDQLIEQLLEALDQVELEPKIRALILRSNGNNFSAGADLRWMRRMADYSREENHADAIQLARLMRKLNRLTPPDGGPGAGCRTGGWRWPCCLL